MFRKPSSLSKQLVLATALALGASSVALADDNSVNPATRDVDSGQTRGTLNTMAQNHSPQGTQSTETPQKKDEQKIESKAFRIDLKAFFTPPTNPAHGYYLPKNADHNYYSQFPGQ
jgi:hypothetical protein